VDIILRAVLDVSTEMVFNVRRGNGVVVDHARDRNILVTEVCEDLKESSTTTRTTMIVVSVRATPKPASSMAHSTVTRALALWAHT